MKNTTHINGFPIGNFKLLDGEKVYELAKQGLNQQQIGAQLGYSQSQFSVKINNQYSVKLRMIEGHREFAELKQKAA